MKDRIRPFAYMAWAKSVPADARYDLTASGTRDTALDPERSAYWSGALEIDAAIRQDQGARTLEEFVGLVAQRYGVDRTCVTPCVGASQAIMQTLLAVARTGDHVIVERPTYEALHRVPELLGMSVSRLERSPDEGWDLLTDRLARLLTPRTRAVILSNLHNPTGVAIPTATMEAVAEMAARVGAMVLVDEVYLDFCFDPAAAESAPRPACMVADNAISWSSTNKALGFRALRTGWIVTRNPDAAHSIRDAGDYLHVTPPLASLQLAAQALRERTQLVERANLRARQGRKVIDRWIEAETRVSWTPPYAAHTGLIRLPALMDDAQFATHLRERFDTQVVPGSMFEAPGFVRVSFALDEQHLEQALSNFSAALDHLE